MRVIVLVCAVVGTNIKRFWKICIWKIKRSFSGLIKKVPIIKTALCVYYIHVITVRAVIPERAELVLF